MDEFWRLTPHEFNLAVQANNEKVDDDRLWDAHLTAFATRVHVRKQDKGKITAEKLTGKPGAHEYRTQDELDSDMRSKLRRTKDKTRLERMDLTIDRLIARRLEHVESVKAK